MRDLKANLVNRNRVSSQIGRRSLSRAFNRSCSQADKHSGVGSHSNNHSRNPSGGGILERRRKWMGSYFSKGRLRMQSADPCNRRYQMWSVSLSGEWRREQPIVSIRNRRRDSSRR